jgi:hypothetical protein
MTWGSWMRMHRHTYVVIAFLATILALVGLAAGCTARISQLPAPVAAAPSVSSGVGTRTVDSTLTAEATSLLAQLKMPETAADSGYKLLGAAHNDYATWTRATVLAATDYGRLASSIASQQAGIDTAAVATFRRLVASRGATAAYDAVLDSGWRLQDGKATKDDSQLVTLIPASTMVGLLLDRNGRLFDRYIPRRVTLEGDVLAASYVRPGKPDATLRFRVVRGADGRLRIAEWIDYAAFRSGLQGDDAASELP